MVLSAPTSHSVHTRDLSWQELGSGKSYSRAGDSTVFLSSGGPGSPGSLGNGGLCHSHQNLKGPQRLPVLPSQGTEPPSRGMPGKPHPIMSNVCLSRPAPRALRWALGPHGTSVAELELHPRSPDCLLRTLPAAPHPSQSSSVGGYEQWERGRNQSCASCCVGIGLQVWP